MFACDIIKAKFENVLISGAVAASVGGIFYVIVGPATLLDLALGFVVRGTLDRAVARKAAAVRLSSRLGLSPLGCMALNVGRTAATSVAAAALIRFAV